MLLTTRMKAKLRCQAPKLPHQTDIELVELYP